MITDLLKKQAHEELEKQSPAWGAMVMTEDKNKYKNHYLDARLLAGSSASRDTKGEKE